MTDHDVDCARVTRRRFVEYGAATIALASPLARAQKRAGGEAAKGAPPPDPGAASVTTHTDAAQRLTVRVGINGAGPYRFVVDTGADRTVLAEDVATALDLPRGEQVNVSGIVRRVAADSVTIRELSIGRITREQLRIPVIPRSMLEADGYLGLDTLDGCRVTFDFKNHDLQVGYRRSKLASLWIQSNSTRIRSSGASGHLRAVDCTVDGVPTTAFIDTGAEISAGNAQLLAALTGRKPGLVERGTMPLRGVTGGEIQGRVIFVDKIQLQELQFTDCALVIADLAVFDIWGLTQRPALLIGMDYLRRFARVSIDYGRKEIRFDLASLA